MTAGLRALMSGVIDYAGMFPPAKLPLEEAVAEYLAIRESPEAWMLGRLVVPIDRVPDLPSWEDKLCQPQQQLRLAVVGPRESDPDIFRADLLREIARGDDFFARNEFGTDSVAMELTMPGDVVAMNVDDIKNWLEQLEEFCEASKYLMMQAYIEVPGHPNAEAARNAVIQHIAEHVASFPEIRFKYRTGGTNADAFPTASELAEIIRTLRTVRCPWKATAGLHHALPRTNADLGVTMHGFLNVWFAEILSKRFELESTEIEELLTDEDSSSFRIDDHGIRWRQFEASVDTIEVIRMSGLQSFGSCSFNEPRDDLRELGLL